MSHVGIKTRRIANGTADQMPEEDPPWQPEHLAAWDIDENEPMPSLRAIAAAEKGRAIMEASRGFSTRDHRKDSAAGVGHEVRAV